MIDIAKQFTDHNTQQNYLTACARFRFPYWDPCLPRKTFTGSEFGVPKIVASPLVYVRMPDNPEVLVPRDNPLYSYKFPVDFQPLDNKAFLWDKFTENVRSSPIVPVKNCA